MIKPNPIRANLNVLAEAQLEQVVGGHGRCGGYRKNYNHRYENRRHNDCYNYDGGYESKGSDDSFDSSDCYEEKYDNYDHCDRNYS